MSIRLISRKAPPTNQSSSERNPNIPFLTTADIIINGKVMKKIIKLRAGFITLVK